MLSETVLLFREWVRERKGEKERKEKKKEKDAVTLITFPH